MLGSGMIMCVMREIDKAVQTELEREQEGILRRLRMLHQAIEQDQISEDAFDREEDVLLNRIDEIKRLRR